ncbi:MAG: hypothetical protein HC869_01045 [Rhodospirillales bacterium]|nr:hypothetical protein [Rhodospirillales bacterium]
MAYNPAWDRPHTPSAQPLWQESDCFWAYDLTQDIGVFFRVGQQVNLNKGQIQLFVFQRGARRFLRLTQDASSALSRSQTGQHVAGFNVESIGNGRMRYRWTDAGCAGDLEFHTPFYEPRNWRADDGAERYHDELHDAGHLEVSGRMRGVIELDGKNFSFDALAHRDRSWGNRDLARAYQHRMCTGTTGSGFSFAAVLVQFNDGAVATMGFVVRAGACEQLRDVEFLTTVDYDSVSVLGAITRLHLESGQIIEIAATTQQGFLNTLYEYTFSPDVLMTFTHEGAAGFCYHTAAINPAKGGYRPQPYDVASICAAEGLSDFVSARPFLAG